MINEPAQFYSSHPVEAYDSDEILTEKRSFQNINKAHRDMHLSASFYKVGSIFIQNGDFDVTVGKFEAKMLVWIKHHVKILSDIPTQPSV